jgi:iron complex transport system substrate-binding protein
MRIVSLLPSATEIVCSLGLQDQLVGVSHSCNYPSGVSDLPAMTRTTVPKDASSDAIDQHVRRHLGEHTALYQLDIERLAEVDPDIVVSQRLCDVCAVNSDDVLAALHELPTQPRLVELEPELRADVFHDIRLVGRALNAAGAALQVLESLQARVDDVAERTARIPMHLRPRVALLEWLLPPFNSGHWNPELVALAGGIDCLGPSGKRSHTISWSDVLQARPDKIVVACCGLSQERTRADFVKLAQDEAWQELLESVDRRVYVTDGDAYFSRPGPRLIDGMEALAHALHPAIHPPSETGAQVVLAAAGANTDPPNA